jgi:hypothetical protein
MPFMAPAADHGRPTCASLTYYLDQASPVVAYLLHIQEHILIEAVPNFEPYV